MEFDGARPSFGRPIGGFDEHDGYDEEEEEEEGRVSNYVIKNKFRELIRNFHQREVFIYRDQLLRNVQRNEFYLNVDIDHIGRFDEQLLNFLRESPNEALQLFETATREALALFTQVGNDQDMTLVPDVQVTLRSEEIPSAMRSLSSSDVNKLLLIPGIIISASRAQAKATSIGVQCQICQSHRKVRLDTAYGSASAPKKCWKEECESNRAGANPNLVLLPDHATFVDQQTLKLQEFPEVVATGEMPRSLMLSASNYLVDKVSPGTRVTVVGISSVAGGKGRDRAKTIKTSFLRVVGIQPHSESSGRTNVKFSQAEEEMCIKIARSPDIYQRLVQSVAPSISGSYTEDIKKAIACLLFGGSRKRLPDGVKLRGDINVLLLGDPSTAKSQFLKFVEKVAPVGVYTSGKGSSAAGLTASVIRDSRGEFFLEGGAMVLADGGVVCIDEFDKMREQDRVAIHEAMEQQTISIAKAGITTILNSRSSVLAAANPAFGTYNDSKSAAENIDFLPTILSRFDMIFIVRDTKDVAKDRSIAKHVLDIHVNYGVNKAYQADSSLASDKGELDLGTMKRYIVYCRTKCAPVLSVEAAELLRNHYVSIRDDHRRRKNESKQGAASTVPITVRQLEAIVRITESLAKMRLQREASPELVKEAIRLFKVSTLNAAQNSNSDLTMGLFQDNSTELHQIEDLVRRVLPVDHRRPVTKLVKELASHGFNPISVHKSLQILVARGDLVHQNQQKILRRLK